MVTEKGSIKAGVTLNSDVQKELTRKNFIFALITLILGSVGIAVYLVFDILSVFNILEEPSIIILICLAALFACGLMWVIIIRKSVKSAAKNMASVEYEFFTDCLTATDYVNGDETGSVKVFYNQIIKRKETATYLFFYINGYVALAIDKTGLSEGEVNALRMKLGLPVKSVQIVQINAAKESVTPDEVKE